MARYEDEGKDMARTMTYEKPTVFTLDNAVLVAALGPSISCTGFGGSVACN